ncbi:CapA family protein [Halobacteriales archaeon Cl-PHB]
MGLAAEERETVRGVLDQVGAMGPALVVASLHWGPNMEAYPADKYREFGRWLVAAGVDVVHGHSAHVFKGVERYSDGVICYDCGDFVDDYAVDRDLRNDRSFLFELRVSGTGDVRELRLHPTEIEGATVDEASAEVAAWCRETMRERSEPFGTGETFGRQGSGLRLAL